jgi:hypothetical protein
MPVSASFAKSSARDVLDVVLAGLHCTWIENEDGISITTMEAAEEKPETKRITLQIDGFSPRKRDVLIPSIQQTVSPSSWDALGGKGKLRIAGSNQFTVTQSQPVLRKIMDLSATLASESEP